MRCPPCLTSYWWFGSHLVVSGSSLPPAIACKQAVLTILLYPLPAHVRAAEKERRGLMKTRTLVTVPHAIHLVNIYSISTQWLAMLTFLQATKRTVVVWPRPWHHHNHHHYDHYYNHCHHPALKAPVVGGAIVESAALCSLTLQCPTLPPLPPYPLPPLPCPYPWSWQQQLLLPPHKTTLTLTSL